MRHDDDKSMQHDEERCLQISRGRLRMTAAHRRSRAAIAGVRSISIYAIYNHT